MKKIIAVVLPVLMMCGCGSVGKTESENVPAAVTATVRSSAVETTSETLETAHGNHESCCETGCRSQIALFALFLMTFFWFFVGILFYDFVYFFVFVHTLKM